MPENLKFCRSHGAHQIDRILIHTFISVQQTDCDREKCGDDIARIISQWIDPENTGEMKKWRDSFKEEFEEEKRQEEMAIIEKLNKIYCT